MIKWFNTFIILLALTPNRVLGASDDCSHTRAAEVYSNASSDEETGDILGYELVLERHRDSTVQAFLYVYEGAPNSEAIPLHGRLVAGKLSIRGDWVEHLIEYPSKKETVEDHSVEINGVLNRASFRGDVTIMNKESVRLRRVTNIWLCKK